MLKKYCGNRSAAVFFFNLLGFVFIPLYLVKVNPVVAIAVFCEVI